MIFRNATAQNLRNTDLIPIIGPLFYESEQGINIILSAIESIDTASLTGTVNIDLILSALEAVDSSNIAADNLINAYVLETENLDAVLLEAKAILTVSLSETDNIDISDITAQLDRILTLESTEQIDKAVIKISNGQSKHIPSIGTAQVWSFLKRLRKPLKSKLKVSEAIDTIKVQAELQYSAQIKASEQRDGIIFLTNNDILSIVVMSEKADATIIDEAEFKIKSDKIYSDYEAHEMAIFAMAS